MRVTAHNRGPGRGDAAPAADAVVPQHVVVGRRRSRGPSLAASTAPASRAEHPELGELAAALPTARRAAVHRERDQHRAAVRRARTRRRTSRTRSTTTSSHGATDAVNPARTGTKAAAHHVLDDRRRRRARRSALRLTAGADAGDAARRDFDARARRRAATRPTSSTRRSPRRRSTRTERAVMRQALAGMLWSKQYYEYDVDRWLREHGVNPLRTRAPAGDVRNAPGSTWSTATSSRCRTSGSTRGSRRGTWPSTARRSSLVDVDFAKEQVELLLQHAATCTRTARSRRTSGTSATSTRRCTRGRRCASTSARPRSAARATASSWRASSSSC